MEEAAAHSPEARENRWLVGEGKWFGVAEVRLCSGRGKR